MATALLFQCLATLAILPVTLAAGFNGAHLFPVPIVDGWTSVPDSITGIPDSVKKYPLTNETLAISSQSWPGDTMSAAPDGLMAQNAFFPSGSFSRSEPKGGFGFYFDGPLDLTTSDHILFSYAVYFPENFDFVMGGKLPGPYGGASAKDAKSCSGGRQEGRDLCWSSRIMWRTAGAGEIYVYLPLLPENDPGLLSLQGSEADPGIYGFSVARGAFTFQRGAWTVISQRVQLNTLGQANGELELWVNGVSTIHATGITIRTVASTQVQGLQAETFFGGSNSTWAATKDENIWFSGYSAAILAPGASKAQGQAAYPLATESPTDKPDSALSLRSSSCLLIGSAIMSWYVSHVL